MRHSLIRKQYNLLVIFAMGALAAIVLFGKLLIAQEFGVHALGADISGSLGLFDAIGVGLSCGVVCARVLLLLL